MKVYVAEGYANFRKLLVEMLQHDGHEVAATGERDALLAMIAEAAPDVLVADHALLGMQALDTLVDLRRAGIGVPVVVMTTRPLEEVESLVVGLAAVRVVRKPFRLEVLQGAIAALAKP